MTKPKNENEKQTYYKTIKKIDNDPTIDSFLDFNDSEKTEQFLGADDTNLNKPRPLGLNIKFIRFIKENWLGGIITLAVIIVGFIAFNVKFDIVRIDTNFTNMNEKITDLKDNDKDINVKIEKIEKNQIILNKDIEFQKERINEIKSK